MNELTLKEAQRIFRLDEETGKLYWRVSVGQRARPGMPAGCRFGPHPHLRVQLGGRKYLVHRIVWLLVHGYLPTRLLDHIDGDGGNNRPGNLRLVSHSQNSCNSRRSVTNKSGVKGVTWFKESSKWMGAVGFGGRQHYLGLFDSLEEAAQAVHTARNRLHGEFANHG